MGFNFHKWMTLVACLWVSVGLAGCDEQGFSVNEISPNGGSNLRTRAAPGGTEEVAPGEVPPSEDGGADPVACDNPSVAQVKICHIPPGNPAAKQTLCVGLSGALNGHGVRFDTQAPGGHGGDYPGDCREPEPAGAGQ